MQFDIVKLVSEIGFPIAITIYTLVKLNTSIENNTKAIMLMASKLKCVGDIESIGGSENGK